MVHPTALLLFPVCTPQNRKSCTANNLSTGIDLATLSVSILTQHSNKTQLAFRLGNFYSLFMLVLHLLCLH